MGKQTFDQYTYLHFAVGIISYYWGFKLKDVIILHTIFELFENTPIGMNIINKYILHIIVDIYILHIIYLSILYICHRYVNI